MNSCDEFIENAKRTLPVRCTVKDLIDLGIYKSDQAAAYARKNGTSPDFFKMPNRTVMYPKSGVISYLMKLRNPSKFRGLRA